MDPMSQERRGFFDGLKVPALDVNAILLSLVAILLWRFGLKGLAWLAATRVGESSLIINEPAALVDVILGDVLIYFGSVGRVLAEAFELPKQHASLDLIQLTGSLLWTVLIWAFFAGACQRIAAMRLAREEGLPIMAALRFGYDKMLSNLTVIGVVAGLAGALYLLCNATVAGNLLNWVPWLGEGAVALLFFVVLASSFLITFLLALGLLGFNLSSAAIATESSDTFDGLTRSWNFILSRPWAFLLGNAMIVSYIAVFLVFAGLFLKISVASLGVGGYGAAHRPDVIPAGPAARALMQAAGESSVRFETMPLTMPGRGQYLYRRFIDRDPGATGDRYMQTQLGEDGKPLVDKSGTPITINVLPAVKAQGIFYWSGEVIGFWIGLMRLVIFAFVLNYVFAGHTTLYFVLRRDVDGDDYAEIVLDEDGGEDPFQLPPRGPAGPSGSSGSSGGSGGDGGRPLPMVMEV